jgi:CBS domain containing-hemolysin-like protein
MLLSLFLTIFLVLLNGFFVAAEFAIVKVRASQIELRSATGNMVAKRALSMVKNLDAYLSATQLGITLASLGLGWIGEEVFEEIVLGIFNSIGYSLETKTVVTISAGIAFSLITVMHIIFGELAPKSIAIRFSESTTMAVAIPLQGFYFIFRPIIWLLNAFANLILKILGIPLAHEQDSHNEEEIRILLHESKKSGAINSSEHELLENVFKFDDKVAEQIMIPRTKVVGIDIDEPLESIMDFIMEEGYSRLPVYKESIDNVIGILYAKDLLKLIKNKQRVDIKGLIRTAYFITERKPINEVLKEFQRKHIHLAVVLDEFGGTAGIVTMEDIIEELVGEIQDEYDEEASIVVKKSENEYIVNSLSPIIDVNKFLRIPLPESEDYDTVNGFINFIHGGIPQLNERIILDNFEITVIKKSQNAVESVIIKLPEQQESSSETEKKEGEA